MKYDLTQHDLQACKNLISWQDMLCAVNGIMILLS
jgi:hypothetical protein